MNQPMTFMWNNETAEMAKKAGSTGGISETGAYEGEIVSAVYTFGKDGSQSRALELSPIRTGLRRISCALTSSAKTASRLSAWGSYQR